jgi:hypothetical protein
MPEQLLQVAVWVVCRLTFEMNLGLFMQRWHEIRRIAVPGQPILPSALLISSKHLLSIGFAGGLIEWTILLLLVLLAIAVIAIVAGV